MIDLLSSIVVLLSENNQCNDLFSFFLFIIACFIFINFIVDVLL